MPAGTLSANTVNDVAAGQSAQTPSPMLQTPDPTSTFEGPIYSTLSSQTSTPVPTIVGARQNPILIRGNP